MSSLQAGQDASLKESGAVADSSLQPLNLDEIFEPHILARKKGVAAAA
jgi:hypothetical protein